MLPKQWQNVYIQKPKDLKSSEDRVPLSQVYDSGYFVSAIFGSEAWVINKKTYYAQPLRLLSVAPDALSPGMITYNDKQYKKFLVKVNKQRRELRLLARQHQFE